MTNVLFICIESSCRSWMAETIFNHLGPRSMRATSLGSRPGSEVKPLALKILRESGIKTDGLGPKLLTQEMARNADRIITMGRPEACPSAMKPLEDLEIEDPSGKTIEGYRKTREIIRQKVEGLLEVLTSESS